MAAVAWEDNLGLGCLECGGGRGGRDVEGTKEPRKKVLCRGVDLGGRRLSVRNVRRVATLQIYLLQ